MDIGVGAVVVVAGTKVRVKEVHGTTKVAAQRLSPPIHQKKLGQLRRLRIPRHRPHLMPI
jgi:hypothetical protein